MPTLLEYLSTDSYKLDKLITIAGAIEEVVNRRHIRDGQSLFHFFVPSRIASDTRECAN